jgi:hypothetical protein
MIFSTTMPLPLFFVMSFDLAMSCSICCNVELQFSIVDRNVDLYCSMHAAFSGFSTIILSWLMITCVEDICVESRCTSFDASRTSSTYPDRANMSLAAVPQMLMTAVTMLIGSMDNGVEIDR